MKICRLVTCRAEADLCSPAEPHRQYFSGLFDDLWSNPITGEDGELEQHDVVTLGRGTDTARLRSHSPQVVFLFTVVIWLRIQRQVT